MEISNMSLNQLLELKATIEKAIAEKTEVKAEQPKNSIYKHDCQDSARYHKGKYKHWAKTLTAVDDTKSNGYAFIGEFLKIDNEHMVNNGSFVVEVCHEIIKLYKVSNDTKEMLAEGRTKNMATFIRECKEITNL